MLTNIKIAGFKSFADPVSLSLNDSLVGVVGPNGCGKSNVADALRWVLGEGSAKSLRADFMGEVIFAGTRERKSLARADVELVFDNQKDLFGGEFARYSEVSVRREIFAGGDSRYYLNGTLCRRRDIAALFLGTGLGAPNYAIVQQGMINRFIEARPEELRLYLEEAAGISYFRKQKQEAESNLRRTAENLDQVRERLYEINRHIAHLESQTRSAARHRELTGELRYLRALRYQREAGTLGEKISALSGRIAGREDEISEHRLERDALALALDQARAGHAQSRQTLDKATENYYQAKGRVSSLEEDIERSKAEVLQADANLENLARAGKEMRAHIESDRSSAEQLEKALGQSDDQLQALNEACAQSFEAWQKAEAGLAQVRQNCHDAQNQLRALGQQEEFDSAHTSSLEESIRTRQQRRDALKKQLQELRDDAVGDELVRLNQSYDETRARLTEKEQQWHAQQQNSEETQQNWQAHTGELDSVRERCQDIVRRLADLRALQETGFGQNPGDSLNWLKSSPWSQCQRLRALLRVSPGWELAAELILSRLLNAVCIETDLRQLTELPDFGDGELILLLKSQGGSSAPPHHDLAPAREYIKGPVEIDALLESVYVADNLEQAVEAVHAGAPGTSVVLREGVWLSRHWLRVLHKSDDRKQVIVREQKIKELESQESEARAEQERLKRETDELAQTRESQLSRINQLQKEIGQIQADLEQLAVQVATARNDVERNQQRTEELRSALAEVSGEIGTFEAEREERLSSRAQLSKDSSRHRASLGQLREEEARLVEEHARAHEDYLSHRDRLQSAQLAKTHDHQEREKLNSNIERFALQLEQHQQQSDHLRQRRLGLQGHIEQCQRELSEALTAREQTRARREELERALVEAGERIEQDSAKLNRAGHEIERLGEEMSEWRIELGGYRSQAGHIEQNLADLNLEEDFVVPAEIQALEDDEIGQRIERATRRLEGIGPVNLVAESEYREQHERAQRLDAQVGDLEKSSATLRETMSRMDAEIRRKYLATFTEINQNLKSLFVRMFSGGDACLKETEPAEGDERPPGVVLMAQPPGKRIARIQQLSGGERTLSAIALMFAFFRLNPAPFCLLDEVDAPLDDINVHRYCGLLDEMAGTTQFIIITHNKITMSRMHVLHGVTMPDAGVSRLVDVDLKNARQAAG